MKTTLFMAISVNGLAANNDGVEDFLSNENWSTFCELAKQYGNFIVGRKTYEAVKNWDEPFGFDDIKGIKKIIVTNQENFIATEEYIIVKSPKEALGILDGHETALLTGGPTLNSVFISEGLINEIIFNIEPILVGKGVNVIAPKVLHLPLEFLDFKQLPNGIIQLRYLVK